VKDVFHVKRLHLGHVAHSFCLKCAANALVTQRLPVNASYPTGMAGLLADQNSLEMKLCV
jgi:hypothetical protein